AVVIGFAMWGNEPDIFRYGKPRFWWPLPAFGFALLFGFLLFSVGGWMMADLAQTADFGPVVRQTTEYSLFGAFWLAFVIGTISQFALNDGNYYEAINGGQNIIGGWKRWRRVYTCVLIAGGGAFSGWLVNYQFTNGFFKVAAFLAITVPTASVIMFIDHFLLPRWFGISRPLLRIPAWSETAWFNWPALVALCGAVFFGAWASGIVPGEALGNPAARGVGARGRDLRRRGVARAGARGRPGEGGARVQPRRPGRAGRAGRRGRHRERLRGAAGARADGRAGGGDLAWRRSGARPPPPRRPSA